MLTAFARYGLLASTLSIVALAARPASAACSTAPSPVSPCVSHDGSGYRVDVGSGPQAKPVLSVTPDVSITFYMDPASSPLASHPFYLGTSATGAGAGFLVGSITSGSLTYTPTAQVLASGLYYQCQFHAGMGNRILAVVVDAGSDASSQPDAASDASTDASSQPDGSGDASSQPDGASDASTDASQAGDANVEAGATDAGASHGHDAGESDAAMTNITTGDAAAGAPQTQSPQTDGGSVVSNDDASSSSCSAASIGAPMRIHAALAGIVWGFVAWLGRAGRRGGRKIRADRSRA